MSDTPSKNDEQLSGDMSLKDNGYWRNKLSAEEFAVCRMQGTERPFSGEYNNFKGEGQFVCRCCGEPLFKSEHKFDSGSGWPSFYAAVNEIAVEEHFDDSHGMRRTEIVCRKCHCHLGHVFPDGPQPTGLRYCVNSLSIKYQACDIE